ncbi:hypothetical protein [Sphingomonas humi]|uniref:N-acetyltransferase domain-containing protein n=1 Tax=Sphingomonas humi TaxID=335630 RepID=A0ABP7SAC0_9SPHN
MAILPLSQVDPDLVHAFFARLGKDRAHIAWKYFDPDFAKDKERGIVWLNKGEVRGFIGLIPARLQSAGDTSDFFWTCDWLLQDPKRSPGVGVRLLAEARKLFPQVGNVGGSDDTHAILPALATTLTVDDAALFYHRPLRTSALLERVEERLGFLPRLSRGIVGRIALATTTIPSEVHIVPCVAPDLEPLFAAPSATGCTVLYSQEHLDWLLGRCPDIVTTSLLLGEQGKWRAAALVWRNRDDRQRWRVVYRASISADLAILARAVAGHCLAEGGTLVTTIIAAHDRGPAQTLKKAGYLRGSVPWPLYLNKVDSLSSCSAGFTGMSYLDTDLACIY